MTYIEFLKSIEVDSNSKTHAHHIIPRSVGGTDDPENLIQLTPAQHAYAHYLWDREHPGSITFRVFANRLGLRSSETVSYEDCLPYNVMDEKRAIHASKANKRSWQNKEKATQRKQHMLEARKSKVQLEECKEQTMLFIQTPVLLKSLGPVAVFILQYFIECQEEACNTLKYKKHNDHFNRSFSDIEAYLHIKRDQAKAAINKLESMNLIDVVINSGGNGYRVDMNAVEAFYEKEEVKYNQSIEKYLEGKTNKNLFS